jgi:hypothetical protein
MGSPIVYDVLLRAEVQATGKLDAIKKIAHDLSVSGALQTGIHAGFEVIRDDSLSPSGKDELSRHMNGFAVFTSEQQRELLLAISKALSAAKNNDESVGQQLLANLTRSFDYLSSRTLVGVSLPK